MQQETRRVQKHTETTLQQVLVMFRQAVENIHDERKEGEDQVQKCKIPAKRTISVGRKDDSREQWTDAPFSLFYFYFSLSIYPMFHDHDPLK